MGYELDFSALAGYLSLFLHGVGVTLGLTAIAASLGIALSIGGAATARWGLGWARALVLAYVELIRNTPFLAQLFFIFFGLPALGIKMTALRCYDHTSPTDGKPKWWALIDRYGAEFDLVESTGLLALSINFSAGGKKADRLQRCWVERVRQAWLHRMRRQ